MEKNKQLTKRSVSPLFNRLNDFGFFPTRFFGDFWDEFPTFTTDMMTGSVNVNVKETDNLHQIQLSAPGYKKENFKIDINDSTLTISNEFSEEKSSEKERYSHKEFRKSSFSRSFYLPENLKTDEITAKYEDGILYIDIPKSESVKRTRKIEIE